MKLNEFFARHPVFRVEELTEYLCAKGSTNPSTRKALLAHHQETGCILCIRRGLYTTVPLGIPAESFSVDPYLLVGKITDDAILGYHTSLEAHGRAYTIYQQFTYLTKRSLGALMGLLRLFKQIVVLSSRDCFLRNAPILWPLPLEKRVFGIGEMQTSANPSTDLSS